MSSWIVWAVLLIVQNFSFTYVSRARNSGSIRRHLIASIFSNGVWFMSQMFIFQKLVDLMLGGDGLGMAIFTAAFYTGFTVLGALTAHYVALKTEKGKTAVGANQKYAQISVEEWEAIKLFLGQHQHGGNIPHMQKDGVFIYG